MTDILVDLANDLIFTAGGDFKVGDSLLQNSEALLVSEFNAWKIKPDNSLEPFILLGSSVDKYKEDQIKYKASKVLAADGIDPKLLEVSFDIASKTLTIKNSHRNGN